MIWPANNNSNSNGEKKSKSYTNTLIKMDHLHSIHFDPSSRKLLVNESNEQTQQKLLSKMKRRKKRKEVGVGVGVRVEVNVNVNEEVKLVDTVQVNQSDIIKMKSNTTTTSSYSNSNCHNCHTINFSKRHTFNLRNNQSITNLALVLITLLISINLLLNVTQATSHINSVWLSKDDVSSSSVSMLSNDARSKRTFPTPVSNSIIDNVKSDAYPDGKPNKPASAIETRISQNDLNSSGGERRINWSTIITTADDSKNAATPTHLYTSSSSLQPAIVSLDQPDDSGNGGNTNSIKRSDSDVTQLSLVRSFNNSDDATLDQVQSWNDRNHTTNAQVQFDETGDQTSIGSYLNNRGNINNNLNSYLRHLRHRENRNSSLAPQYDSSATALPPSTDLIQRINDETDNQLTLSKLPTINSSHPNEKAILDEYISAMALQHNKSDKKQSDINASDLYYISENNSPGDNNWISAPTSSSGLNTEDLIASPEPPQIVSYGGQQSSAGSQARRRLHNSGTQYDLRERERAALGSPKFSNNHKQLMSDGEMLAYNGGDEDDENRLKSVTVKHEINHNDNSVENQRPIAPNLDTFTTTTSGARILTSPTRSRIPNQYNKPTTPTPSFHHHHHRTSPSLNADSQTDTPIQVQYPISKYLKNEQYIPSNIPKGSRFILQQAPPTVPQRFIPQRQPTPVVSLIAGIGPDGVVTRQDDGIWNQLSATKLSNQRDKLRQQLLLRQPTTLNLPILNYVRSPIVTSAPGRNHLGLRTASVDNGQSEVNQKPAKKSLLAALSNRFNNWVDAGRGNNNNIQQAQNSLEHSFYNTNHYHGRRMRPQQVATTTPWASSNYYHIDSSVDSPSDGAHFYGDNSMQSSAAIRHPVALLGDNPPTLVRHHSPIAYYPGTYKSSNKGNYITSYPNLLSMVQQPTVSPAPSQIERFYGNSRSSYLQKHKHNRYHQYHYNPDYYRNHYNHQRTLKSKPVLGSEPSPASFIPVVAVSVTKTSPAPMSSANLHDISTNDQPQQHDQHNSAAEIDNYLDMRVGNINRDRRSGSDGTHRSPYRSDGSEFGNYASGSIMKTGNNNNDNSRFLRTARPAAHEQHTTTVRSAVFGYLPHQIADNPLLKAVNILPQFTPRVSYSPGHHITSASDTFVNHGDHGDTSNLIADAPLPLPVDHHYNHQDDIAPLPIEEAPNLSFQLQANSFVQNDIAHPFLDQQSRKTNHYSAPNLDNGHNTGSHSYGGVAQQQMEPIDVFPANQHHLHGFQLFKPGTVNSYLGQGNNFLTNPLLADSPIKSQANLLATPSELNPLMQGIMLANPTNIKFQIDPDHHNQYHGDDQTTSSSSPVSSSSNTDLQESSEDPQKGSSLNKGKKRSSEFFANAGQLLLSALPLLLAPTLGLMFASTPNSVARYQGSNPFSSSSSGAGTGTTTSTGSSGSVQHSLPSTYINSLNSGSVSNPSPAPVVFTPTPPGYLMTTMATPSVNRPSKSTKSPQHTTVAPNSINATSRSRSTTPKVTITTTLSPPPYLSASNTTTSHRNNSLELGSLVGKHDHTQSVEDDTSLGTAPTTILHDTIKSSFVTTNSGDHKDKNHYDIGYEGADYDAQFASLRKPNTWYHHQNHSILHKIHPSIDNNTSYLDQNTLSLQKPSRLDKNRYQYSEVIPIPVPQRNKTIPHYHSHDNIMDEVSSKLYPVSTRRKTVSLVTSNGNKTLLDSSDKYPGLYQAENTTVTRPLSQHSRPPKPPKPPKPSNIKHRHTTPLYDEEDGGDDEINTTIEILTRKTNPNLLSYEHLNSNATSFDLNSLLDLESEQSAPGNSKLARRRRKRDTLRINSKLDEPTVVNKTKSKNRTRSKKVKRVKKVKISEQVPTSLDYNSTAASAKPAANQLMTTLESNNTNSIDGEFLNERVRKVRPANSISDNQLDQLRGDASKSKSAHIITTMITHADDEDDQAAGGGKGKNDYNISSDGNDFEATNELRDQLIRKKMILDRMASNSFVPKLPRPNTQQMAYEEQNNSIPYYGPETDGRLNNSMNGNDWLPTDYEWQQRQNISYSGLPRGRFPPPTNMNRSSSVPIEVIATKIKLFPDNMTEYGYGENSTRRKKESSLVLNDDTKKALANFGSLLIKDTFKVPKPIQIPDDIHHDRSQSIKNKRKFSNNDANTSTKTNTIHRDDDTYGAFPETSSTEPILTQTTSFPITVGNSLMQHNLDNLDSPELPQHRSDNYPGNDYYKDYYNPTNPRAIRYSNQNRRFYPNRSEDYAPIDHKPTRDSDSHLNNYRNHNLGYDIGTEHHQHHYHNQVRPTMRDQVSLLEADLPNYTPADDRSTENGYIGNNIAHPYPTSSTTTTTSDNRLNNQYQRGSHLHTYKSDPTAPINSYSLYTMPHINRSSSVVINNNDSNQDFSQASSGFYAKSGNHTSQGLNEKRDFPYDHPSNGYSVSGDSHVYTHSNGHYGPNRRDTPHHQHRMATNSYGQQSSYEPRNHGYQQHDPSLHHQIGTPGNYQQQESNNEQPYQFTTFPPSSFAGAQQPIYYNHKPSGSSQYQHHNHGDYLTQINKPIATTSNHNDHVQDSTPYSHQQHLPKFYQPSSEIRYPTSTNRAHQDMNYVPRPIDTPSVGNVYYSPSPQLQQALPLPPPAYGSANHALTEQSRMYTRSNHYQPLDSAQHYSGSSSSSIPQGLGGPMAAISANDKGDSRIMNEYFKRVQFSDSDRDKLMASYLTCDGLLNDNDHCLERLSCEFSDKQNIEKANKLDRAVSSILLGHILINTYIPNQFKLRLKNASLFGHTQSGRCAKYVCNKLSKSSSSIN